jgi:Ulp1 family protease
LAGASRSRVVATLRDYLRIEYRVKEGRERDFNKDTIKGSTPKVPQQTNFTDCGVYVLQYVESFFQVTLNKYLLVAYVCICNIQKFHFSVPCICALFPTNRKHPKI